MHNAIVRDPVESSTRRMNRRKWNDVWKTEERRNTNRLRSMINNTPTNAQCTVCGSMYGWAMNVQVTQSSCTFSVCVCLCTRRTVGYAVACVCERCVVNASILKWNEYVEPVVGYYGSGNRTAHIPNSTLFFSILIKWRRVDGHTNDGSDSSVDDDDDDCGGWRWWLYVRSPFAFPNDPLFVWVRCLSDCSSNFI